MEILLVLIGLCLGCVIMYLVVSPRLKVTQQRNDDIAQQNKELSEEHLRLLTDHSEIHKAIREVDEAFAKRQAEKASLDAQVDTLTASLDDMRESADKAAAAMKETALALMQSSLCEQAELMAQEYQKAEENYKQAYLQAMQDAIDDFNAVIKEHRDEINVVGNKLKVLREEANAAVAASIREQEKKENATFYTVGLSELDIQEVKKIKEIIPYLRNGRPLSKAIWECYYRNPTTDLVNRVVGAGTHTGIYRITCTLDDRIYIGQARDIGDRWKTHIKCGLGIDTPANKLYTAMLKNGIENYTFEVIEECAAADLNQKEKYWIDFYQSSIYGYNMTSGGSRA